MATFSKTGITTGNTVQAWHVTQSIDAFTGLSAYNVTLSGSLTLTGSVRSQNGFTGSLLGTASWASNAISSSYALSASYALSSLSSSYALSASQAANSAVSALSTNANNLRVSNTATTNQNFRLLFAFESGFPAPNNNGYVTAAADSGSDGSGLYYNPQIDTLYAANVIGTASYANTASVAITATTANNVNFTYRITDDVTNTASISPFPVAASTPYNIYVSQSSGNILGLSFGSGNDGQVVNFTPNWRASNINLTAVNIIATADNVFGLGGVAVTTGNTVAANTLIGSNNSNNLMFQYVANVTSPIHPATGWYLINPNIS